MRTAIRHATFRLTVLLAAASLLTACDSTAPSTEVIGQYAATTYLIGEAGATPGDVLAAGGSYSLTLASGQRMTQELQIPASFSEMEGEYGMEVEGGWSQSGTTITLMDPFVETRYQPTHLIARGDSLTGEHTVGGRYVKVVFHRR